MNLSGVDSLNMQPINNELQMLLKDVQTIQDSFCKSNRIYGYCYLKEYGVVTDITGRENEKTFLKEHFSEDKRSELIAMFSDGNLENVITQQMDSEYLLLQGIAIRGEHGELIGVWVMMVILSNRLSLDLKLPENIMARTSEGLDEIVLFVQSLTEVFIRERSRCINLKSNLDEVEVSERKLESILQRNTVMTEILKNLESEDDFTGTVESILKMASSYLDISESCLFRINPEDDTVDMVAEWTKKSEFRIMNRFTRVRKEQLPFITGRPFTISADAMIPDDFMNFFGKYGIQAGVFLPITINDRLGMYLGFVQMDIPRKWDIEEVKFLNDVRKVVQSILSRRITRNSLASSYTTIEAILENSGCGIAVLDMANQRFLYTNETFKEMLYEDSDRYDLDGLLLHTAEFPQDRLEYYAVHEKKWFEVSFGGITWIDGRGVRLCTLYDITDSKNYQKRIEHQASVDYMTGLLNRKRFEADLASELRSIKRYKSSGAVIYMDLDDFKNINEGLGHEKGDLLLQEVASGLERIAGIRINTYRIGGDEFALLLPQDKLGELSSILGKLQNLFDSTWNLEGKEYYCTMSAGVVLFPADGDDANVLLRRADYALRHAKVSGKNRVEFYSDESSEDSIKRLDMERALRKAVDEGCREFEVYYQPMVDTNKPGYPCCGAEALIRWKSETLGFVMPSDFIPLAEYLGLIVPIGEYVLYQAAERCKYWNDYGHPEYTINVNLSVVQLMQEEIIDTVNKVLNVTGLNPNNLTLEVTEGMAVQDFDNMQHTLEKLRKTGIKVALDDFGTGYSSLSYIRNLPLDSIKIDKTFINDVGEDEFSNVFVETVSKLADTINVDVVVEGVEVQEQADALSNMNVDVIQGYLYDKPLSKEEFERKYLI